MSPSESAPPEHELRVGLDYLRQDAQVWSRCAERAEALRDLVFTSKLDLPQVTVFGGNITGLYSNVTARQWRLLKEGADNFRNVAEALLHAADQYEDEERRLVHETLKDW